MFARISTFTLLALSILATATAVLPRADGGACGASGTVQCCNSTQSVSLPSTDPRNVEHTLSPAT